MPDAGMKGQFDADALRRKVSDLPAGDTEDAPSVLNPFALQIASQFRDENTSPSLLIGQIRLLEFLSLLALGLLAMVTLTAPDNAGLPTHFAIALLGALVSVIAMQAADTYQIPLLRIAARARRRVVVAWLIGFAASAGTLHFVEAGSISITGHFVWFFGTAVFLLIERQLVAFGIRHWARNGGWRGSTC